MSSRSEILARIKAVSIEKTPVPDIPAFKSTGSVKTAFVQALEANHVLVIACQPDQVKKHLEKEAKAYQIIVSNLPEYFKSTKPITEKTDPHTLNDVELAIINGEIGIGENGAIWISEASAGHRVLPFIAQHLLVVIKESQLVHNMHEGYAKINPVPNWGAFIAGPSKTADIEQTLVIGAHGPKKMTVVLVK